MKQEILSTTHSLIKRVAALQQKKYRDSEQLFLAEGVRVIETLVTHGMVIEHLFVTERRKEVCTAQLLKNSYIQVSDMVMKKITPSTTPSGILAVFRIPKQKNLENLNSLILFEVGDPGNMGTLIRTAAAFSVQQIILVGGVDPYAPKVVASSAGMVGAVNICQMKWESVKEYAHKYERNLTALTAQGGIEIAQADRQRNRWLVLGSEAHGLPSDVLGGCAEKLTIPMSVGTESLNVAVAGAIALYELSR